MRPTGSDVPAVEARRVTKIFNSSSPLLLRWLSSDRQPVTALHEVTLTIWPGEIFGLIGRNGAGKTTFFKCIATLIEPTRGSLRVFGLDTVRQSRAVRACIGLVTSDDRSFYWRLTGWQNLLFFARLYGLGERAARQRIGSLLDLFEMSHLGHERFHTYSTGAKQKLAIVRALLTDPPLILLDEPTRSLDPLAAADLRQLIRQQMARDKTVIIASHNLAEVEELCGRIAIISRGEIKECGTIEELSRKYSSHQRVQIHVCPPPSADGFSQMREMFPWLRCSSPDSTTAMIEFPRHPQDDRLTRVLAYLTARGAKILACQTTRVGLKEIIQIIERSEPPPR
jgi:ABC-2 type transport system ATP-binding protein